MFLDANIFIYIYSSGGPQAQRCQKLLDRIAKGEQNAMTSTLVVNEVLYHLAERKGIERAAQNIGTIISTPHLTILGVEANSIAPAIEYMRKGLETSDAFHAALMRQNGIKTLCSYDKDFDKIKEIKRKEP
ncbi:MAG: type II toxin-antitoxin system VapC family toxin [Candidatus Micrarchaeota archaeon]